MLDFIVNPTAGSGRALREEARITAYLTEQDIPFAVHHTQGVGHATSLVQALAGNGSQLCVLGGDGTLREAAQGALEAGVTLALLPGGSGNDFLCSFGLPSDALAVLKMILSGEPREVDVPLANGVPFINVLGIGIDAQLVERMAAMKKKSKLTGLMLYLTALLRVLSSFRPVPLRFQSGEREREGSVTTLIMGNGICFGGGMHITPLADPTDGELDICVVRGVSRLRVLSLMPSLIRGKHLKAPEVEYFRCKAITIEAPEPLVCQADGELLRMDGPVHITMDTRKLSILLPAR